MKLLDCIVWRKINNIIFLINTEKNMLYELNDTASFVFEKLLSGVDEKEIIKEMSLVYDVDAEQLKSDVMNIVKEFYLEGFYEK